MKENEKRSARAEKTVKRYMLGSLAVGLAPIPLVDMAALTGIQLKMLHSLAKLYGHEFSNDPGKSIIGSLLGGGVSVSVSSSAVQLLKNLFPLGRVASMVSASLFGGASTYAIGKVFIQHFESGGSFLTFDPDQVRDYYSKQFESGKIDIRSGYAGVKP